MKVAGRRRSWLANTMAYTVVGALTSAGVGAALGAAGSLLGLWRLGPRGLAFVLVPLALLLLARELGLVSFPMPQLRRQTRARWGAGLPAAPTAAIWGADLGLTFSTHAAFSGAWLLVAVAIVEGSPALGAELLVAYWLGRALSAWAAPFLIPDAAAVKTLLARVERHERLLRTAHAAAIVLSIVVLAGWLARAPV